MAGTAVYLAGAPSKRHRHVLLAVSLLGSVVPDFDFLPGILIGNLRAFHHGISHSLAFAGLFGLGTLFVVRLFDRRLAPRAAALAVAAYASHVLLDLVSVSGGSRGVPLLWPLLSMTLGLPLGLFGHFRYGDVADGIWSVVKWSNVMPLLRETFLLGALVLVLVQKEWIRRAVRAISSRLAAIRS